MSGAEKESGLEDCPYRQCFLNRSKKVLTDGSANLTGRDFERLFDGDTTLSHLQRIARKVDVKVDGKKKDDLIDDIKQKLKKEKVAEPVMISRKRIIQAEKLREDDTGFFGGIMSAFGGSPKTKKVNSRNNNKPTRNLNSAKNENLNSAKKSTKVARVNNNAAPSARTNNNAARTNNNAARTNNNAVRTNNNAVRTNNNAARTNNNAARPARTNNNAARPVRMNNNAARTNNNATRPVRMNNNAARTNNNAARPRAGGQSPTELSEGEPVQESGKTSVSEQG